MKLLQEVEFLTKETCGNNRIEREEKMKFSEYISKEDFMIPADLK